jgi:hypothetical protein
LGERQNIDLVKLRQIVEMSYWFILTCFYLLLDSPNC